MILKLSDNFTTNKETFSSRLYNGTKILYIIHINVAF
jgi:hypothetical protein